MQVIGFTVQIICAHRFNTTDLQNNKNKLGQYVNRWNLFFVSSSSSFFFKQKYAFEIWIECLIRRHNFNRQSNVTCSALCVIESLSTYASIRVDAVLTGCIIFTWTTGTFVDIYKDNDKKFRNYIDNILWYIDICMYSN